MTSTSAIAFDPGLLEFYSIIRSTPAWTDVQESMKRLAPLRKPEAKPYDQMDLDRDNVLRYAGILSKSADSIAYGICLAAHLSRFSKTPTVQQRLNESLQALSTGLDLPALAEADTRSELARCIRAAFPNQKIDLPPLQPTPPDAPAPPPPAGETSAAESPALPAENPVVNPWRSALESFLNQIREMDPLNIDDVKQRASDAWQARLQAFLSGQPEVAPDIDYLRCRAMNLPLGMVLRGRLKNVGLREWSETYVAGMFETGVTFPVPLWFSLAALGALGFDVPRDLVSVKPAEESKPATEFVSKIPTTSPPRGLVILRLTADSQTTNWKISTSMPALIITPADILREGKVNLLQSYFQPRLHGVLIEVARDEQPAVAVARANVNLIKDKLPSVRLGLLMASTPTNTTATTGYGIAVLPSDALDAHTRAFAVTQKVP